RTRCDPFEGRSGALPSSIAYSQSTPSSMAQDSHSARMRPLVDTHCHLDVQAFDDDRDAVLCRARAAGVAAIVVPAIRPSTFAPLLALVAQAPAPELRVALGIHPQIVPDLRDDERDVDVLEAACAGSGAAVVAVGECGLDGATGDPAGQEQIFRAQIRIARAL